MTTENTEKAASENTATTAPEKTTPALILHQFPRTSVAPSLSPFALKLETYLRLAKTVYQNDFNKPFSGKGKCPWISYNNQDVADSSMCIDFLKNVTNVDLNAHLSETDKAIARAFQKMVEEELTWVLSLWRWTYDKEETVLKQMGAGKIKGFMMLKMFRSRIKGYAHGHGIGRHSQTEVMKIGEDDIKALGDFLGSKKYFMGENVSEVDCTVFAILAEILYTSPTCPLTTFIKEKYTNLAEYCDRFKGEVWSDWEEICQAVVAEKEKKKAAKTVSNAPAVESNGTPAETNGITENGAVNEDVVTNGHETSPVAEVTKVVVEAVKVVENGHTVQETTKTVIVNGGGEGLKENGHHVAESVAPAV